jgi:O-antigen/teichoic acid export membrane protein
MGVVRTASLTFVFRLLGTLVGFAGLFAFIALLGPDRYGSFVLFQGVVSVAAVGVSLGIDTALEKRISGPEEGAFLPTAIAMKLVAFVPAAGVLIAFRTPLAAYFHAEIAVLAVPTLLLYMIGRTLLYARRGEFRVGAAAGPHRLPRLVFVGGGTALGGPGGGVRGVIWAFAGGWATVMLVGAVRTEALRGRPSLKAARSLFAFLRYSAVVVVFGGPVYTWADTLIIGTFLPPTLVTAYEAAWRITRAAGVLSGSVSTAIFPVVSDLDEAGHERISELFPRALVLSTLLVFPAAAGAVVVGRPLLSVVFDPALGVAATAMVVLLLGRAVESVNDVVGHVLLGIDKPDLLARSAVVLVVLTVGLNVLLVPPFGLTGGAIATATAFAVHTWLNVRYLCELVPLRVPTRTLAWTGIASVAMAGTVFAASRILPATTIPRVAALVGLGVLVYAVLVVFDSSVSTSVRAVLTD